MEDTELDYDKLKRSIRNLETQHRHLLELPQGYPAYIHEAMAESVIQRFETCYDTLWKMLKRHLVEVEGIPDVSNSPRGVFRIAHEIQFLLSGFEQWDIYAQTRTDTTHDYSREKAGQALPVISEFIDDAISLYEVMTGESWE